MSSMEDPGPADAGKGWVWLLCAAIVVGLVVWLGGKALGWWT